MDFKGVITKVSDLQEGVTLSGKAWAKREIVVTESNPRNADYPDIIKVEQFKTDDHIKWIKEDWPHKEGDEALSFNAEYIATYGPDNRDRRSELSSLVPQSGIYYLHDPEEPLHNNARGFRDTMTLGIDPIAMMYGLGPDTDETLRDFASRIHYSEREGTRPRTSSLHLPQPTDSRPIRRQQ